MDFATTTENVTENLVLTRPPGDSNVPKGRESCDGFNLVGKAVEEKGSYIVREECKEETERGEGPIARPSASHCGPSDQATVESWAKAGPISCPSPEKSNSSPENSSPSPSSSAEIETGWTPLDCSCLGIDDLFGMESCACCDISRFSGMNAKKDPNMEIIRYLNQRARFH